MRVRAGPAGYHIGGRSQQPTSSISSWPRRVARKAAGTFGIQKCPGDAPGTSRPPDGCSTSRQGFQPGIREIAHLTFLPRGRRQQAIIICGGHPHRRAQTPSEGVQAETLCFLAIYRSFDGTPHFSIRNAPRMPSRNSKCREVVAGIGFWEARSQFSHLTYRSICSRMPAGFRVPSGLFLACSWIEGEHHGVAKGRLLHLDAMAPSDERVDRLPAE